MPPPSGRRQLRSTSDEAAAAFIRQHISNGQLHLVAKICTAHEKPGMNHALLWINIVVSTKLAPGASVQKHINTIRTANERLTSSGLGFEFGDSTSCYSDVLIG